MDKTTAILVYIAIAIIIYLVAVSYWNKKSNKKQDRSKLPFEKNETIHEVTPTILSSSDIHSELEEETNVFDFENNNELDQFSIENIYGNIDQNEAENSSQPESFEDKINQYEKDINDDVDDILREYFGNK